MVRIELNWPTWGSESGGLDNEDLSDNYILINPTKMRSSSKSKCPECSSRMNGFVVENHGGFKRDCSNTECRYLIQY